MLKLLLASIKQQVPDIGNKFLNSVEISAQEEVYIILQLPMRKSSQNVAFVNTYPLCNRVELLKLLSEIERMSDESEEIHSGGLLKQYVDQPDFLQNVTLADWAAWYDSCGQSKYKRTLKKSDVDNLLLDDEDEHIMMMNFVMKRLKIVFHSKSQLRKDRMLELFAGFGLTKKLNQKNIIAS